MLIKPRIPLVLILLFITPLGFATKFYSGAGEVWMHHYAGAILYEIFWIFLVAVIKPDLPPEKVSVMVFLGTALLEFGQLWHPEFLEMIRGNFLGRTILGNGFDLWDFLYYLLGCGLGWRMLRIFQKRTG